MTQSLIERLQAASGPDRELDRDIVLELYPEAHIAPYCLDDEDLLVFHAEPLVRNKRCLPAFTASIDTAMTLVPEGWSIAIQISENRQHQTVKLGRSYPTNANTYSEARTPALALCAAALRARESTP